VHLDTRGGVSDAVFRCQYVVGTSSSVEIPTPISAIERVCDMRGCRSQTILQTPQMCGKPLYGQGARNGGGRKGGVRVRFCGTDNRWSGCTRRVSSDLQSPVKRRGQCGATAADGHCGQGLLLEVSSRPLVRPLTPPKRSNRNRVIIGVLGILSRSCRKSERLGFLDDMYR
jgi:hypothetical protein